MGHGGKREGAGKKKGTRSQKTLERLKIIEHLNQRTMRVADVLFDSQLTLSKGQTFLYKIEKKKEIGPKGGVSYKAQKPELVTKQWEIEAYLEGLLAEGDMHDERDPAATYYYLTTKEPNNMSIDSMLNRALGKPKESVEVEGDIVLRIDV